jgi:hypothetical protein
VTERVLFLPPTWLSPEGCDSLPALTTAFRQLSSIGPVGVHRWPPARTGIRVEPTWQAAASELAASLSRDVHLISLSEPTAVALMAIDIAETEPSSFIAVGMGMSPAALRSVRMSSMAATVTADAGVKLPRSGQVRWHLRRSLIDAPEEYAEELCRHLAELVDWDYWVEFDASSDELDILRERPRVTCPTLFLQLPPAGTSFTEGEPAKLFMEVVPDAEVGQLEEFPLRLYDPDNGRELVDKVLAFRERRGLGRSS